MLKEYLQCDVEIFILFRKTAGKISRVQWLPARANNTVQGFGASTFEYLKGGVGG